MSKKILRQRVLNKLAKEWSKGKVETWEEFKEWLQEDFDTSNPKLDLKAMLETIKWIERAVDLAFEEVEKEIDEIEEGFEGTAVEFCEKHGDASYTGFKECLKDIRSHLSLAAKKKEAFNE